jgi:HEAT repeat protein
MRVVWSILATLLLCTAVTAQDRIQELEKSLRAEFPERRALAALELINLNSGDADNVLRGALNDGTADTRQSILRVIGERRASKYLPEVLDALESTEAETRGILIWTLKALPFNPTRDALVTRLQSVGKDESVYANILSALAEFRDPMVISELLAFCGRHPEELHSAALASASTIAMEEFRTVRGLKAWNERFKHLDREGFLEALLLVSHDRIKTLETDARQLTSDLEQAELSLFVNRLEKFRAGGEETGTAEVDTLLEGLSSRHKPVRQRAADEVQSVDTERLLPRLEDLIAASREREASVRNAVLSGLRRIEDPRVFAALIEALAADKARIRSHAAELLAGVPADTALAPLLKALSDPNESVRLQVVTTIGGLKANKAVSPLLACWSREKHKPTREAILNALGTIGDPSSVPTLVDALNDEDKQIRYKALTSLGRVGDPKAAPDVLPFLEKDRSLDIRIAALNTLGRMKAKAALPNLLAIAATADEDPNLRAETISTIRAIEAATCAQDLAGLFPHLGEDRLINLAWDGLTTFLEANASARPGAIEKFCKQADPIRAEELFEGIDSEKIDAAQINLLQRQIARAWSAAGEPKKALDHFTNLARAAPEDSTIQLELAQIHLQLQTPGPALDILIKLEKGTEPFSELNWRILLLIQRAELQRGNIESVVTAIQAHLSEDSPSPPEGLLQSFKDVLQQALLLQKKEEEGS